MSFMGGGTPAAASPATAARVNTYREAEAVPFLVGTARVAPKWISDRFNDQWSNGKMTGQAYCSIVGVLCHGPLDKVSVMYQGGEALWTLNLTRTAGQDYASFSFGGPDSQLGPTYVGRIYWGTETQTADAWLVAKSGQDHPPYRGFAYVVFERLHCGQVQANSQAQPAVPNIEFLCTRLPSPHLPAELRLPATLDADFWRGVNFVSALYDVLTHPRAGLDCADYLDTALMIAAAQGIEAGTKRLYGLDAEYARVSVLLTGGSDAESVLGDFLAHADGFASSNNGLVSLDWFPNDGSTPSGLPTINQHDLAKHPEINLSLLDDVPTSVAVTCLDYWADLAESVETCNVPFTKQGRGDSSPQKLGRPWITERFVAAQYAARHAALAATPAADGKLSVLIHRAVRADGSPLRPGDRFLLNYEPDSLLFICRVTEIEEPDGSDAVVDLSFIREHGTSALPYVPEVDPRADYELPEPATPGADDWVVMETPPELGDGRVVVLIRRPQNTLAGAEIEMDDDNNWAAGTSLLGRQGFAAHGTLTADITSSAGTLTLYGTGIDLGPTLASGMTSGQQADNTLLAYVGGEWLSVGAVTSVATDTYQLALLRGRLGSTAAAHTAGAAVWIIARAELTQFTHALFTSESTRYFKAATYHSLQTGTPSAAKSVVFRKSSRGQRWVNLYKYSGYPIGSITKPGNYYVSELNGGATQLSECPLTGWYESPSAAQTAYEIAHPGGAPIDIDLPPFDGTPSAPGSPVMYTCAGLVWSETGAFVDQYGSAEWTAVKYYTPPVVTSKAAISSAAVRLSEVKPKTDAEGWSTPIYHSATGKFQIRKNAETDTLEWTPDGGTTVHAMGGGGASFPAGAVDGQMIVADSTAEGGVRWTGVSVLPAPNNGAGVLVSNGQAWYGLSSPIPGSALVLNQAGVPVWATVAGITYDPNAGQPQITGTTLQCTWQSNGDGNGIFYALGTNLRRQGWANPVTSWPKILGMDSAGNSTTKPAIAADRTNGDMSITTQYNSQVWMAFDLGQRRQMAVTDYTLRFRPTGGTYAPRSWVMEGSNNVAAWTVADIAAATWVTIDERTNDTTIPNTANAYGHFVSQGDSATRFRFIRFRHVLNASNQMSCYVGNIEFYGACTLFQFNIPAGTYSLDYVSNGDGNGLVYFLGSVGLTKPFENPIWAGDVAWLAEMSPVPANDFPALFDHVVPPSGSYVTAGAWVSTSAGSFVLDLGANRAFSVSRYSIHYAYNSYFPRNWKLQGIESLPGFTLLDANAAVWTDIDVRTADTSINAFGWVTLVANGDTTTTFRYLRWLNTGPGSNGDGVFRPSELEFYGALEVTA